MIDKLKLLDIIHTALEGSDKFLVDMKVTPDNRIFVSIDSDTTVQIDDCVELSRAIEAGMNRDEEDFELNVASAGLDNPFRNLRQYKKNIGNKVCVTTLTGDKQEGILQEVTDSNFTIKTVAAKKTPARDITYPYAEVKSTTLVITF